MELFIYLLKTNVAIMLFYLLYRLIFQRDTFFAWKRILLLSMVVFAFIYPLFDLSGWFENNEIAALPTIAVDAVTVNFGVAQVQKTVSFTEIALLIAKIAYFSGVIFIFLRIFWQILSVLNIFRNSQKQNIFQSKVFVSEDINAPFSFFGKIVFNPKNYSESEINEILLHENSHIRQLHSFDVLLAEILCAFAWFNPFAWMLKREIRLNLEFLADKNVVSAGCELKNYQFNLLKISYQNKTKITNNFNFSPIKKRIIMLKRNQTTSRGVLKYALLLPIFAALLGINQSVMSQNQKSSRDNKKSFYLTFSQWKNEIKVAEKVDVLPQFAGGEKALYKFIADNFQVPAKDYVSPIMEGNVPVTFTVDTDGSIKNIQASVGVFMAKKGFSGKFLFQDDNEIWPFSSEAARVAGIMPKWKPAMLNGKPVQTTVNMLFTYKFIDKTPIIYILNGKEVSSKKFNEIYYSNFKEGKKFDRDEILRNQIYKGKNVHLVIADISKDTSPTRVLEQIDKAPQYPGGEAALYKFIAENFDYLKTGTISGDVVQVFTVNFVVNSEGKIENFQFPDDISNLGQNAMAVREEAKRVLMLMPRWTPGQLDGKNVDVQITLPIKLKYEMTDGKLRKVNTEWINTKELDNTQITFSSYQNTENTLPNALYIVDGKETPSSEVYKINPNNIASTTILKDTTATEIYGEKGKNGVVLITLKKGNE